jgi:rhamnopyranosyl-N-acetylglucosaminyl-diphospho-decaprenol beta-1,3/1,4-galactofuranosyltransferase
MACSCTERCAGGKRVVAVVVTHNRPALLGQCLTALQAQARAPDKVMVVDNASGPETERVLASFPQVKVLRQTCNLGAAAAFRIGLAAALRMGADWVWVMDDDGRPRDGACLHELLSAAARTDAELVAPLVVDVANPGRLAFPLRVAGRTRFRTADVLGFGDLYGFAHLFNGALIGTEVLFSIGLPDPRLFIRGDEVEFLYRARRARTRIVLATGTRFLHPGSAAEIHAILGGLYYATLPVDERKQFFQFRNRAWIFRHYGMWPWLLADVIRYGCFFLASRRDPIGFGRWVAASWAGLRGDFMLEKDGAPVPIATRASWSTRLASRRRA